jgi:hypothetical protein
MLIRAEINNQMDKEEIIEVLESARYNCDNLLRAPSLLPGIAPLIKGQIETAIKEIDPEYELMTY